MQDVLNFLNNDISKLSVMVLGDVMLDRYFIGEVNRISPEAPVPVNLINMKRNELGGAANVAHNLAKLGVHTSLVGVIGDDHHGRLLLREMKHNKINCDGIFAYRDNTTTKIRIIGASQQMIRMDFEDTSEISETFEEEIISYIKNKIKDGINAIIISDYKKGLCSNKLCREVIELSKIHDVLVFVDPKGTEWEKYIGADYITPNVKELGDVTHQVMMNQDIPISIAAHQIQDSYSIPNVIVTRSEKGMSLFLKQQEFHMPTTAKEVYDVSGAGDTVISVLTAAISGGLSVKKAAEVANLAAGIEVAKNGTYAVSSTEIIDLLMASR